MSYWLTASQAAGLPGLPKTSHGVKGRAKREAWPKRPHVGRGGGLEYAASALPAEARAALLEKTVDRRTDAFEGLERKLTEILDMLTRHRAEIDRERAQIAQLVEAMK